MTGQEIKTLREKMGLSQRQFGERIGVEQATVSRLEKGEWAVSGPLLKLLESLAAQAPQSTEAA